MCRQFQQFMLHKQAQAVGIPDMDNYGRPFNGLSRGELVDYVLQHHDTVSRPGRPHYDLRLGKPDTGLFSWAVPKARMPEPSEKLLAPQTQVHAYGYGDFTGKIGKGYGAGTVSMADRGKALITKSSPNSISFTLAHTKTPVRYQLIRIADGKTGKPNWLLTGVPVGTGASGIGTKPRMKLIQNKDLDKAMSEATSVQAKIDGAHTVYSIGPRGDLEGYSYRRSVTGQPIVHTERLGLGGIRIPELKNTEFRGEAFGMRGNRPARFSEVSAILNSRLDNAVKTQQLQRIRMQNAPFAVSKLQGKPVTDQQAALKQLMTLLPKDSFQLPETVVPGKPAYELLRRIRTHRQPQTDEGIVLNTAKGDRKYKLRPELTAKLVGTYPGTGKREHTAGGLLVKTDNGKELRVGTGFTDQELADIVKHFEKYRNQRVRIGHYGVLPSGLVRAPSYQGMEV